mgnify:FL=1
MNWKKEPLGKICKTTSGGTPSRKNQSYYQNGTIPWVKSGELENNIITTSEEFITEEGLLNSSAKIFPAGTLLIALYGATIGKLAFLGIDAATNQAVCGIFQNENVSLKYLYYYLLFQRPNLIKQGVGGAQPNISQTILKKLEISYPDSITEQQRIVARIEELFSELDKAVDTLKTTKEQLEVYRQTVLKEIFDSVSTTSVHIKDVCLDIKVGIVIKPTQYYVSENGVPAFRNANVRRGYINDTDWVMISKEGHQQNCRSEVHTNDVLISRSGANLGMASVVPARYNGYNAIDVVIAVPDISKVIPEFLAQYTNSPMGRAIVKKNERGAAQGHLNVSAYANLPIGVPDLQEQEKLVKQISDRLSVCDSIEKTVDAALAQADAMRQSILKQAFEEKD